MFSHGVVTQVTESGRENYIHAYIGTIQEEVGPFTVP